MERYFTSLFPMALFCSGKLVPLHSQNDTKDPTLESKKSVMDVFRESLSWRAFSLPGMIAKNVCQNDILFSFLDLH